MMNKLGILLGAGVGYVLGARAGRDRYDQMARAATKLWRDPRVQEAVSQAQDVAADAADRAGHSAKDTLHGVTDKLHGTDTGRHEDVVGTRPSGEDHFGAQSTPTQSPSKPSPTPPSTPSGPLPPHPRG